MNRLQELTERRGQLNAEIAQIEADARTARRAAVEGGGVEALAACESRRSALTQVLSAVEGEIAQLEAQEATEAAAALREEQTARLVELANQATELSAAVDERTRRGHDELMQICQEILDLRRRRFEVRREYRSLVDATGIKPGVDTGQVTAPWDNFPGRPDGNPLKLGLHLDNAISQAGQSDGSNAEWRSMPGGQAESYALVPPSAPAGELIEDIMAKPIIP
jgi:hypothetical protein